MSTELSNLKNKVKTFCEERDWDRFHDIKELAIGVSTESAELLEIFRFLSHDECEALFQNAKKRQQIEDEVADVFFFLLRISGKYGVDLAKVLDAKLIKNGEKYPIEKARGSNRKYDDF